MMQSFYKALDLKEVFSHPDTCQKDNTEGLKTPQFMESTEDNILAQAIEEPTGKVLHWSWYL